MASLNLIQLIGNLGSDPNIKTFSNGGQVAEFSLATTMRGYKTRDGRDIPERTEWHNIVLHNNLVKVAEQYLHKGDSVYLQGEMRTRSYEKNGQKLFIAEVHADKMQLLTMKRRDDNRPMQSASAYQPQQEEQTFPPRQSPQEQYEDDNPLPF